MKQVRARYSKEYKIKAVELTHQQGSLQSVSDQLKINPETLRLWRKAYADGRLSSNGKPEKEKSKEELELLQLRKENYELKLERDILKKAVSIFSKSDR